VGGLPAYFLGNQGSGYATLLPVTLGLANHPSFQAFEHKSLKDNFHKAIY
jgi:hypothetical protein